MPRLAFGNCVFDRERRELARSGSPVHAGPKSLLLLELLIDSRPRALTKEEIHKQLWPDTFVSDATLTSLVAELRAAVGDDARAPELIRTVYGYGYAFCGEIEPEASIPPDPSLGRSFRVILGEREISLGRGAHILGRASDAVIFVDDTGVSRHHARITIGEHGARLEDLGSKNGTRLNGRVIEAPAALDDGALIVLGATVLKFRVFQSSGSTETLNQL